MLPLGTECYGDAEPLRDGVFQGSGMALESEALQGEGRGRA